MEQYVITEENDEEETFSIPWRITDPKRKKGYVAFKDRKFIAWDGEGRNRIGRSQAYMLFGNSEGGEISGRDLGTDECLSLIVKTGFEHPNRIHVWYGGNYDVNMILKDVPKKRLEELNKTKTTKYKQWIIENLPRKWFRVYDKVNKINVKIYDVVSFFNCIFIEAVSEYLGDREELKIVETGKAGRNTFRYRDLESKVRPYMRLELILLVDLMTRLRNLLASIGVHPTSWHGPGAIATKLLQNHGLRDVLTQNLPEGVKLASQYAYFGGHVEPFKTGYYDKSVYSYDIRGAYPYAMSTMPNISKGLWIQKEYPALRHTSMVDDFGLYKCRYRGDVERTFSDGILEMHPFPYRDSKNRIHYPTKVEGWYWGVEVNAAITVGDYVEIDEAWVFVEDDPTDRPFAWINELYERRMIWKREGNPAQLAAKLGLNSIYGKLAQRVGWNEKDCTPPSWHQLEYAGYAVATSRAMVYIAMRMNPSSIITVETDGIFSTQPLNLTVGERLGEWEKKTYEGILFVQNGIYFTKSNDGWSKGKVRGFGKNVLTFEKCYQSSHTLEPVTGQTRRFAGMSGFLGKGDIRHWIENDMEAKWGGGGKRTHSPKLCRKCCGMNYSMHDLIITQPWGGKSHKHLLPWKDGRQSEYATN